MILDFGFWIAEYIFYLYLDIKSFALWSVAALQVLAIAIPRALRPNLVDTILELHFVEYP